MSSTLIHSNSGSTASSKSHGPSIKKVVGKKPHTRKPRTRKPAHSSDLKFPYEQRLAHAPLARLIRQMANSGSGKQYNVQNHLVECVELYLQEHLGRIIKDVASSADKDDRKTVMAKDLKFVLELRGEKPNFPTHARVVHKKKEEKQENTTTKVEGTPDSSEGSVSE